MPPDPRLEPQETEILDSVRISGSRSFILSLPFLTPPPPKVQSTNDATVKTS